MKKNKGITLIALVVTVVVLLILAAISIGALMGENGTITKTQEAKKEHEIGEEREIVDLSALQAASEEEYGIITEDKLRKALEENMGGRSFSLDVEETQFVITFNDSGRKYYVPKEMQIPTDNDIKFTYDPSEWTTQDVTVTVETTLEGYTIETSTDNSSWSVTNQQTRSSNEPVYVRLKDSTGQVGGVATGNVTNIDKNAPSAIITLGGEGTVEANPTLYATVNNTDDESGVYLGKYILTINGTEIGINENDYLETFVSNDQQIEMALPSEGEYYIHVLTIDKAGNKRETISKKVNLVIKSHTHSDECYKTCPGTIVSRNEPYYFDRDGRRVLGAGIKCNTCDFAGFTTSNTHSEDYVLNWYKNNLGRKCGKQSLICTKDESSISYEISY